jgi:hypothetical protein
LSSNLARCGNANYFAVGVQVVERISVEGRESNRNSAAARDTVASRDCETIGDKVLFSFIRVCLNSGGRECGARVDFSVQRESVGLIYFRIVDSAADDGNDSIG